MCVDISVRVIKNDINKFCVNLCSADSGLCNTFFLSFFLNMCLVFLSFFLLQYFYMEKNHVFFAQNSRARFKIN